MFKSILVPLDGSHFAEHALPLAASVAEASGATLRLLQVLPPLADRYFWAPPPGSQLERDLHDHFREKARTYLEGIEKRLKGRASVAIDIRDEHIDIPEAIDAEVANARIDLVVMPSHGRGTFERFWLGSIADDVYRSAAVPVLLAKPQNERADLQWQAPISRVLVALDGTPQAEEVLDSVLLLGLAAKADLLLVRVVSAHSKEPSERVAHAQATGPIDESVRANAPRYLNAMAEILKARGTRVRTEVLESSDVADAIVKASAESDLIAMQTHARRGVSRLMHGSIVHEVVAKSAIPILITRPHGR